MTLSEAFDRLEQRCIEIGMMTKDGEAIPADIVMAKVGKRYPEDDNMLWDAIQSGDMTPKQFYHSYMSLILQFNVERQMTKAVKKIREIGSANESFGRYGNAEGGA